MSARIFLHPRSNELFVTLVNCFASQGYTLHSTTRGHIEARRVPTLTNVVTLKRKPQCRQQ